MATPPEPPLAQKHSDHLLDRPEPCLDRIEVLVIDEADHVFDLGFLPHVRRILRALPPRPREEVILRMRFGVGDDRARTLEEVGKAFALTRERIRQIEAQALAKLRHPSRSRRLEDLLR